MSALDRILQVTVTRETRTVSRQGFGTMMFPVSHVVAGPDVVEGTRLSDFEALGFTADVDPYAHRNIQAAFAQDPSPTLLKVGRRTNVSAQTVTLTPLSIQEGVEYDIGVNGEVASYEVQAGDGLAEVVAGIVAAINGLTGAGSDPNAVDNAGANLTITAATPALRFYLTGLDDCALEDETTDGGIATDLAAIYAQDPDFYGVVTDAHGKLELGAAAAWIESQKMLHVASSSDSEIADSGVTDDIASVVDLANYARTGVIAKRTDYGNGTGSGWLGQTLTEDPMAPRLNQKKTWAHRTIASVPVDTRWSEAQKTNINAKKGTFYGRFAGLDLTFEGQTGAGEFFDIPQFVDAFVARLQERFVQLFATQDLVFDEATRANFEGQIQAIVNQAIDARQIAVDPKPLIVVPAPLDVPVADRAARRWTGIEVEARLTGAVHAATLVVNLTV